MPILSYVIYKRPLLDVAAHCFSEVLSAPVLRLVLIALQIYVCRGQGKLPNRVTGHVSSLQRSLRGREALRACPEGSPRGQRPPSQESTPARNQFTQRRRAVE